MEGENTSFSDLLQTVGGFGRWNKVLLLLSFYSCLLAAASHLSIIYLAFPPSFNCSVATLNSRGASQDVCELECDSFLYDSSVFASTVVTEWDLVCENAGLLPTLTFTYMLGIVSSILSTGLLSDYLGRRKVVLTAAVIHIVASFVAWLSPDFWLFLLSRMVLGGTIHSVWAGLFILVQETTPREMRAITGGVMNFGWNIGALLVCLLAYLVRNWRDLQLAFAVSSLPMLLYFLLLPESPRWLLGKGRVEQSRQSFMTVAKYNGIQLDEKEFSRQFACIENASSTTVKTTCLSEVSNRLTQLLATRHMRYRTLLLAPTFFAIGMASYGIHFASRFASLDLFAVSAIKEVANLTTILVLIMFYHRVNRTPCLASGYLLAGLVAISFCLVPDHLAYLRPVIMVVSQALFVGSYFMVDTYAPELLPTPTRNFGFNLMDSISKTGSALAPFVVDIGGEISPSLPTTVFGVLVLVTSVCFLFLPETRSRPLPQNIESVEKDPGHSIVNKC